MITNRLHRLHFFAALLVMIFSVNVILVMFQQKQLCTSLSDYLLVALTIEFLISERK